MARYPLAVLALGVIAVSTASVLIRLAQAEGMSALAVAAYRMLFAALILAPFVALPAWNALGRIGRAQRWQICGAGVALALHFATWISSLQFTSVASSVALVTSHPLWITLLAFLCFRERPGVPGLLGVSLALVGAVVIFASDHAGGGGSNPMLGNSLALVGALSVTAYILIARAMPAALGTWTYVWLVYAFAAVLLVAAAGIEGGLRAGVNASGLLLVLAMALVPQLIGHTAINWSARRLSPTLVSVGILGEPVLAAATAWVVLGEGVRPLQLLGFGITLCGILLCALDKRIRAATMPA